MPERIPDKLADRARLFVALGIIVFLAVTARELSPQWLILLASMLGIFTMRRREETDDDEPTRRDRSEREGMAEPADPPKADAPRLFDPDRWNRPWFRTLRVAR